MARELSYELCDRFSMSSTSMADGKFDVLLICYISENSSLSNSELDDSS